MRPRLFSRVLAKFIRIQNYAENTAQVQEQQILNQFIKTLPKSHVHRKGGFGGNGCGNQVWRLEEENALLKIKISEITKRHCSFGQLINKKAKCGIELI